MTEQYLQSLVDGLDIKCKLLDELTEYTNKQQQIVAEPNIDWEEFDRTVDKKAELIEKLDQNDNGFQAVFDRIKDEVKLNKEKYKSYIEKLQSGILRATEKSTALLALEQRTKAKVEQSFSREKSRIQQSRSKSKAVNNYYNNMNRINFIDPQLMDQKK